MSKNEGELKKRFEQKVKFGFILDFNKVLDEAKKDFPESNMILQHQWYGCNEKGESRIEIDKDIKVPDIRRVLVWFKKWFGE